jgi:hypothetical protein
MHSQTILAPATNQLRSSNLQEIKPKWTIPNHRCCHTWQQHNQSTIATFVLEHSKTFTVPQQFHLQKRKYPLGRRHACSARISALASAQIRQKSNTSNLISEPATRFFQCRVPPSANIFQSPEQQAVLEKCNTSPYATNWTIGSGCSVVNQEQPQQEHLLGIEEGQAVPSKIITDSLLYIPVDYVVFGVLDMLFQRRQCKAKHVA